MGHDPAVISSHIYGGAVFSPYLDNGTTSAGVGFHNDLSHTDVTDLGPHLGGSGPIEAGILATVPGGTVTVEPGKYLENDVTIDKNLTLRGRGDAVLQAASGFRGITIINDPQNVTISGLLIVGFGSSLVDYGGGTLNLTDVVLNGTGTEGLPNLHSVSTITNVTNLNLTTTTTAAPRTVSILRGPALQNHNASDATIQFFDGIDVLAITGVSQLSATTGNGYDTFSVAPLPSTAITIDGGNPTPPASPGDTLNMDLSRANGANLSSSQDASGYSGSWTFSNAQPVSFSHIETLTPSAVAGTVIYVATDAGFTDAAHPGNPQAGDAVTWPGGGSAAPVANLIFGVNAFDNVEAAVAAAAAGDTIEIAPGLYIEADVVIDKKLTLAGNGSVTLQGPPIPMNPTSGPGHTGIVVTDGASEVTLANLTVQSFFEGISSATMGSLELRDVTLIGDTTGAQIEKASELNIVSTSSSPQTVSIGHSATIFTDNLYAGGPFGPPDSDYVVFSGQDTIDFSVGALSVTTGDGGDTFNVSPLNVTSTITIDGGDPTPPASPGDTLNMILPGTTGAHLSSSQDASGYSGSWTFTNAQPVTFSHIETLVPDTTPAGPEQDITATEGMSTGNQLLATFTDSSNSPPDNFSANINWGDGTSSTGAVALDSTTGIYSVSGTHTYAEDGNDQIIIAVSRGGSADLTLNAIAGVVEPPLVAQPEPAVLVVWQTGVPYSWSGSFTHGSNTEPTSGFTATIDWGDGTTTIGTISLANSMYTVGASHAYQDAGLYQIRATEIDTSAGNSATLLGAAEIQASSSGAQGSPSGGQGSSSGGQGSSSGGQGSSSGAQGSPPGGTSETAVERFISDVYAMLLHRAADAGGLAYFSAQVGGGAPRSQIVSSIEASNEYLRNEIDAVFEQYLHRHADPGAVAAFSTTLKSGQSVERVAGIVASSDEYFADRGGHTNSGFLNALFEDAIQRPIDANSKAAFAQTLASGGTRADAVRAVLGSAEFQADLVDQMYLDVLGRSADAAGLLAAFLSSNEYFGKTAS